MRVSESMTKSKRRHLLKHFWFVMLPAFTKSIWFSLISSAWAIHLLIVTYTEREISRKDNSLLLELIMYNQLTTTNYNHFLFFCGAKLNLISYVSVPSYHKAKLVFHRVHSLVPSYFSLYFTRFSNIHNYSTRQSMRLSLPSVKQNFGKRTFLFTGAKIFNKLPLNILKNENIQTFCLWARHFFLS